MYTRVQMCVSMVRACRGTLVHPDAYMCIYSWCVRVGVHSHAHACMNMCDGMRVGPHSYIYGCKNAYIRACLRLKHSS